VTTKISPHYCFGVSIKMKNNFYKVYAEGTVVSSRPPVSYTIRVNGADYEIEYSQMHAQNIGYPDSLLSGDGHSLSEGATIHLVGICRHGQEISWRPAHEEYLKCLAQSEDSLESEASKKYLQILKKGTEQGLIPKRLSDSIVLMAQGSPINALIQLKIFLGLPIKL